MVMVMTYFTYYNKAVQYYSQTTEGYIIEIHKNEKA